MKVALIQCPVWGTREPPLAIVQLSACLKASGIETKSFDFNNFIYRNREDKFKNLWAWEQSMFWYKSEKVKDFFRSYANVVDSYINRIMDFSPDIIGLSLSASTFHSSCEFAKKIRKKNKSVKVVFGGQLFFNKNYIKKSFQNSPVDYILAGEADQALPQLARTIELQKEIKSCPGVYFKKGDQIKFTGQRPLIEDLDNLPYSDFSDLKIQDYDDDEHISIMASRGCVWNCAFCSSRAFWGKYRYMSGERIHQEIVYQRITKGCLGHIDFMDLVFNGSIKRVEDFCRLMIDYPPPPAHHDMRWTANAIIHPALTKDLLFMMAESGCKRLIFGIESGSERVLKLMKKPFKISDAKRIIKDASSAGIQVTTNFMFGFPGETEKDFQKTLDFIKDTGEFIERVYPSRTYCAIEEFSHIERNPDQFGIKKPFSHHLYWKSRDGLNTYPVRLQRCARFEKLCNEMGFMVDCGVQTSVEMDNWYNLAHYYEYEKEYKQAAEYFKKYLKKDPLNKEIREKKNICEKKI